MTTTTKRSIKLYRHLTPKQKAVVAMGVYDAHELDVIAGTVERKNYRMLDVAFTEWTEYAFKISVVIGLDFWRQRAVEMQSRHAVRGVALLGADADAALTQGATDAGADAAQALARQSAALAALEVLSTENGFTFADCLRIAEIHPDEVLRLADVEPDAHHLDHLLELREAAPHEVRA